MLAALAMLMALPAMAQPAPIPVFFMFHGSCDASGLIDQAMHAVLGRPDLIATAKPGNRVLEAAIEGKVAFTGGETAKRVSFTLAFWRDGDKLGEAVAGCQMGKVADCADQIASDLSSADQIHH
jgi:hypothetical protein